MGTCTAVKREIALTVNSAKSWHTAGQNLSFIHTTFEGTK
jgi:hypothetical protein